MTPVYLTSTYVQDAPGEHQGYDYAPRLNPTRTALQANLAALEGGAHGVAFASGLAATDAVLDACSPRRPRRRGATTSTAAPTASCEQVFEPFGLTLHVRRRRRPRRRSTQPFTPTTKLLWVETPTNPLLQIVDIAALAELAHARGALLVVDNTFATPVPPAAARARRRPRRPLARRSTSAGTPTSSAARSSPRRRAARAAALPERGRRGAGPAGLLPRCCAAPRRSHLRMERHCDNARRRRRASSRRTRAWRRSSTRGSRTTPATPSRRGRCAASAGWSRSSSDGGLEAAVRFMPRTRCSRSPRASAASRAWSTTRRR